MQKKSEMTSPTVVLICVKLALQTHAFTSVFTPTLAIQNLQHEIALNFPITLQQSPPPPNLPNQDIIKSPPGTWYYSVCLAIEHRQRVFE